MQHQAVLLIQQYTVLQVRQPAGERDILRRYNTTSGSRQSGARFKLHIFSGPGPLIAFLGTGGNWLALLVGFLCLGVATMIYLPFVIAANKVNNMTTNG